MSGILEIQRENENLALYKVEGSPDVPVHTHLPPNISRKKIRVISVHHGVDRNAKDYLENFMEWANKANYIVVAPCFSNQDFPKSAGYNLGNLYTKEGSLRPAQHWTFTICNEIAIQTIKHFRLKSSKYDLWGHSAGGQFVHRMLLFLPNSRIRYAMPANPGWWTLPSLEERWPYGLKPRVQFPPKRREMMKWMKRNMVIFRGTEDKVRGKNFRITKEAEAQGKTRFERAGYMYLQGKNFGMENFGWELVDVKGVGHSHSRMAVAAQKYLDKKNLRKK